MKRQLIGELSISDNVYADAISEYTSGAGVTVNDEVYMPGIGGSGTGTSIVYFNRATGELTYGDAPAGGSMVYPTGDGIPIVVSGTSWGTTITDNSTNWDTAHGWGDHDGLYDLTGTAAGLISTHESTYNHANYDTAYDHSQLTTGNPHVVGYADITDFNTGVSTYETSHSDVVVDADFGSNGILYRIGVGSYGSLSGSGSVDTVETTLTDDDSRLPTSGAVFAAIGAISDPVDDILDWSTDRYAPYTATADGVFYTGTTDPAYTTRLNYGGAFAASHIRATPTGADSPAITAYTTNGGGLLTGDMAGAGSTKELIWVRRLSTSGTASGNLIYVIDRPSDVVTATGSAFIVEVGNTSSGTTRIDMNPRVADGASAVAYIFDTHNALSTTGAKLLSLRNQGNENFFVDYAGGFTADGASVNLPGITGTGTGTSVVLYNRTTGALTYGDLPTGSVSLGADNQIPVMVGTTDFDYSANLTFNGTTLDVGTILTVNTINEHTASAGVTIEGMEFEDDVMTLSSTDHYIAFGDATQIIGMSGLGQMTFTSNSSIHLQLTGTDVLVGTGINLAPWGDKNADLGATSQYWDNAYFDRVYVDQDAVYIDVTGTGATLDMTFTSTLSGTVNLNDLIGGSGSGVTSVAQGDGMEFTTITGSGNVHMGTPTTLTLSTTNSASGRTHEHALSIANFTSIAAGLVPLSGGGTTNFLRADATWAAPPAGTVTSITDGNGMNFTDITATGTVTMGTPSTLTLTSANGFPTADTHSHALSIANFTSIAAGLVPLSGGGTTNFLRADGTWAAPPGAGSVSWGTETGWQEIVFGTATGNVDTDSAFQWNATSHEILVNGGVTFSGAPVNFTGLSVDNDELYVVAIDNGTGLLSKRAVSTFSSASLTFSNGITETTGDVKLGGALTQDTSFTSGGIYNMTLGTNGSPLNVFQVFADNTLQLYTHVLSSYGSGLFMYPTTEGLRLFWDNSSGEKFIEIDDTAMMVTDEVDSIGFQYGGDYSTNGGTLGNRWIPDKEYVDGISDRRLKDGIVPYTEPVIGKIQRLITYIYHLKKDPSKTLRYGLMADEVEAEFPYAVQEMDGGFQSVRYKDLVPILMQGLKELKDELDTFKSSIKKP